MDLRVPPPLLAIAISGLLACAAPTRASSSVEKFYLHVRGARVAGLLVNLSDPGVKISIQLARGFPGADEPFAEMAQRAECVAAITGTYFGVKNRLPVGDLVVDGKLRWVGARGTAMVLDWKNQVSFRRQQLGVAAHWTEVETVIAAGPTLVRGGRVEVAPRHEGFSDPGLFGLAPRCAVGVRAGQRLVLVTIKTPVSLWETAKIMRDLGCQDAMNLDGGTSSALWFRGRVLVEPGRRLVNLLTVHENVPIALRARPAALVAAEQRRQYARERFELGQRLELQSDPRSAVDAYDSALQVDPLPEYALATAHAIERLRHPESAVDALDRAGQALLDRGRADQAATVLRRAVVLAPGRFGARRKLAEALRQLGLTLDAEAEIRRARILELMVASPLEATAVLPVLPDRTREPELRAPRPVVSGRPPRAVTAPAWNLRFTLPRGARLETTPSLLRIRHELPYTIGIQTFQPPTRVSLAQAERDYHAGSQHRSVQLSKRAVGDEPASVSHCESNIDGRRVINRCVVLRRGPLVYAFALSAEPATAARALADFSGLLDSVQLSY